MVGRSVFRLSFRRGASAGLAGASLLGLLVAGLEFVPVPEGAAAASPGAVSPAVPAMFDVGVTDAAEVDAEPLPAAEPLEDDGDRVDGLIPATLPGVSSSVVTVSKGWTPTARQLVEVQASGFAVKQQAGDPVDVGVPVSAGGQVQVVVSTSGDVAQAATWVGCGANRPEGNHGHHGRQVDAPSTLGRLLMDHVIVRQEGSGYWLDPRPYLEALHILGPSLPPGARAYAQDQGHYDFTSRRCVKDLWFGSLAVNDDAGSARLTLLPNASKHDEALIVEYQRVESTTITRDRDPGAGWFGSVLLDELIPTDMGVSHELALTGGRIHVVANDVSVHWEPRPR